MQSDAIGLGIPERWEFARIVAGEAPVALMGHDAAVAVAWTVRNRLRERGARFWRVVRAYHGRAQPSDAEHAVVAEVLAAPANADPTGGARWAMSRQDREAWQFRPGDLVFEAAGRPQFQIHIYRESPFLK